MTDDEIEEACRAAIQAGVSFNSNPLNIITTLLSGLVHDDEFKSTLKKCHHWLFDHQDEMPFLISSPESHDPQLYKII